MKTQINNLRSGTKSQVLNPEIDYSSLPHATSHIGHAGTNDIIVAGVWEKVKEENSTVLRISVMGETLSLVANWSLSGKSVSYSGVIPETLFSKIPIDSSRKGSPTISVEYGNIIVARNGGNAYTHICPSLITILD